MAISTGKKARRTGGTRIAIKRSKPKPGGSRYQLKLRRKLRGPINPKWAWWYVRSAA